VPRLPGDAASLGLAFEPRGWQVDYRHQLRGGLRGIASAAEGGCLVADFAWH